MFLKEVLPGLSTDEPSFLRKSSNKNKPKKQITFEKQSEEIQIQIRDSVSKLKNVSKQISHTTRLNLKKKVRQISLGKTVEEQIHLVKKKKTPQICNQSIIKLAQDLKNVCVQLNHMIRLLQGLYSNVFGSWNKDMAELQRKLNSYVSSKLSKISQQPQEQPINNKLDEELINSKAISQQASKKEKRLKNLFTLGAQIKINNEEDQIQIRDTKRSYQTQPRKIQKLMQFQALDKLISKENEFIENNESFMRRDSESVEEKINQETKSINQMIDFLRNMVV